MDKEKLTKELQACFSPNGYRDMEAAAIALHEAGISDSEFVEACEDFAHECGMTVSKLDICAYAYDYILQQARTDIESAIGIDIMNDTEHQIGVAGNFCATTYDYSEEAKTEFMEIVEQIEDKTKAIEFVVSQCY